MVQVLHYTVDPPCAWAHADPPRSYGGLILSHAAFLQGMLFCYQMHVGFFMELGERCHGY